MGTASVFQATIRLRDMFTVGLNRARVALESFTRAALRASGVNEILAKSYGSLRGKLLSYAAAQLSVNAQMKKMFSGYEPYIRVIKKLQSAWVSFRNTLYKGIGYGALGFFGALSAGMLGVVAVGVKFNASMEQNQMAFKTFLGSSQKATKYLKQLYDLAAKTPFEFPQLTRAARTLIAFGFSAKGALKTLTNIGDAVSAFGGTADQINQVVLAMGQIQAKGVVQGQEILQLAQAGIPANKILQKYLHLTGVQVGNIGKLGIKASVAIKALNEGMAARFGGMAVKQSTTLAGLWSTLKDYFAQAAGGITKSFMPALKRLLNNLINFTQWTTKVFTGPGSLSDHFSKVWDRLDAGFNKWYQRTGLATVRKWGHKIGKGLADLIGGSTGGKAGGGFFNLGYAGVEALAHGFLTNLNALKIIFSPMGQFFAIGMATTVGPKIAMAIAKAVLMRMLIQKSIQGAMASYGILKQPGPLLREIGGFVAPPAMARLEKIPGIGVRLAEKMHMRGELKLAQKAAREGVPYTPQPYIHPANRTPEAAARHERAWSEVLAGPVPRPTPPVPPQSLAGRRALLRGERGFGLRDAWMSREGGQAGARMELLQERNASVARMLAGYVAAEGKAGVMSAAARGAAFAGGGPLMLPGRVGGAQPMGTPYARDPRAAFAGAAYSPGPAGRIADIPAVRAAVRPFAAANRYLTNALTNQLQTQGFMPTPLLGERLPPEEEARRAQTRLEKLQKFGERVQRIPAIGKGVYRAGKFVGGLTKGVSGVGAGMAVAGGLGMIATGISGGFDQHPAMAALSGAATGAGLGTMIGAGMGPGGAMIGAVGGGVVGALTGALFSIFGKDGQKGILVKTDPNDSLAKKMDAVGEGITAQRKADVAANQGWYSRRKASENIFGSGGGTAGFMRSLLAGSTTGPPGALAPRFSDPATQAMYTLWKQNAIGVREEMQLGAQSIAAAIDPKHLAPFVRAMSTYLEAARALAPAKAAGPVGEAARRFGVHAAQGLIHPGGGRTVRFLDPVANISAYITGQLKSLGTGPGQGRLNTHKSRQTAAVALVKSIIPSLRAMGVTKGQMPEIIAAVNARVPGLDLNAALAAAGLADYSHGRRERARVRTTKRVRLARQAVAGVLPQLGSIPLPPGVAEMLHGRTFKNLTRADLSTAMPALMSGLRGMITTGQGAGGRQLSKESLDRAQRLFTWLGNTWRALPKNIRNLPAAVPGIGLDPNALSPAGNRRAVAAAATTPSTAAARMLDDFKASVEKKAKPTTAAVSAVMVNVWSASSGEPVKAQIDKSTDTIITRFAGNINKGLGLLGINLAGLTPADPNAPAAKNPVTGGATGDFGRNSSATQAQRLGMAAVNEYSKVASIMLPPGGAAAFQQSAFLGATDVTGGMPGGVGGNWGGSEPIVLALARATGLPITSQKRARKLTASGNISDHWIGNKSAYATDLGVTDRKIGDPIAQRLAAQLGTSWEPGKWTNTNAGGYKWQIGWQVPDHFDHIHLGAHKLHGGGQFKAPSKGGEGWALLRDNERIASASGGQPAAARGGVGPITINYHGTKAGPTDVKKIAQELAKMLADAERNYSIVKVDG